MRSVFRSWFGKSRRRLAWSVVGGVAALLVPLTVSAFTGQAGQAAINFNGAVSQDKLGTTVFTAPSTVSCMVTVDITTGTNQVNPNPSGTQLMWPLAQINGSNQYSGQGAYVARTVLGGYHRASSSRLFTVSSGSTARFGCHIDASGDFANSSIIGNCRVTYSCIVP